MQFLGHLNRYASIWTKFQLKPLVLNPNRDIYATTGLGPRKNREMAGVDDLVVYMQTAVKYSSLYIHHPGGASRPRGGVYRKSCILQQFAYTPPNRPHQPFPYFF